MLLGVLIVLYVGHAARGERGDGDQRRPDAAPDHVRAAVRLRRSSSSTSRPGLIVYWITTNVWTIGQQLVVKKLYPKPDPRDPRRRGGRRGKPARGKPAAAAALTDGGSDAKAKPAPSGRRRRRRRATGRRGNGGAGQGAAAVAAQEEEALGAPALRR